MMQSIPQSWRTVRVGDLTLSVERKGPRSLFLDTFNYIDISAVDNVSKTVVGSQSLKVNEAPSRARQLVFPDDILVSTVRPGLNAVAMVPYHLPNAIASTGFCVLRPRSNLLLPGYLFHFLTTDPFVQCLVSRQKGGSYPAVTDGDILSVPLPLPPLSEQQRIVEILQETEEIRRLRAEAEAKTTELIPAMFEGVFGDPARNPRKWDIEQLAALINDTPKNGLYKPADLYGEGTPIIRIADFTGGVLRSTQNLQRVRIADEDAEQFGVRNGQILINRVNSIEHLGKSLLVASLTEQTVYESNMMRLDPRKEKVLPEFLIACLQHASIVAKLRAKAKKAINQASINQTDVLTLQIPVPPLSAQTDFSLQVSHAEGLRASGEHSLRAERALSAALSAQAFSGQLTANWRETHQDMLALETRDRDAALKEAGAIFSRFRRTTIQEMETILQDRTDGIYAELSREQRVLLREIERMAGGVRYAYYFSAHLLSNYIPGGPLRRNPQAIEEYLAVFAARGLIIPVSREEQTEDTGEFVFGNAYRLPLDDREPHEGEEIDPRIGDHTRFRELERLAAQLEKERALT